MRFERHVGAPEKLEQSFDLCKSIQTIWLISFFRASDELTNFLFYWLEVASANTIQAPATTETGYC